MSGSLRKTPLSLVSVERAIGASLSLRNSPDLTDPPKALRDPPRSLNHTGDPLVWAVPQGQKPCPGPAAHPPSKPVPPSTVPALLHGLQFASWLLRGFASRLLRSEGLCQRDGLWRCPGTAASTLDPVGAGQRQLHPARDLPAPSRVGLRPDGESELCLGRSHRSHLLICHRFAELITGGGD